MNSYVVPKQFVDSIDSAFWNHVTRESVIRDVLNYGDVKKDRFLYEIARRINSGNYRPKACKIVGFPKGHGVIRPVLHFGLEDTIVYYYCVKEIQDELIAKIQTVPYVFGGFRLTEKLRLSEESVGEFIYDPDYEAFVKNAFRKSWSDYQNLAKKLAEGNFDYLMHLDIAHFYDAIPLNKLEQEVRNAAGGKKPIVDLLFYLLKNVKTVHNYSYTENIVGLPQEEVGEMSRILANFYLSYFDQRIVEELVRIFGDSRGVEWQYTRYADDLWFSFKGEKSAALNVTQIVSQILSDLSLHLNESKTKIMTPSEYSKYWCFSDWDRIIFAKGKPDKLVETIKDIYTNRDGEDRWFSAFNYGLKAVASFASDNKELIEANGDFFVEVLLQNPNVAGRSNSSLISLITQVVKESPERKKKILDFLSSQDAMYPLVSFVTWGVFFRLPFDLAIFEALSKRYFAEKWRDLWWYERCIFLNYIIEKKVYEDNETLLAKLLAHIANISENLVDHERRYVIRLLNRLPDQKGVSVLNEKFTETGDKRMIEHLRK